MARARNAPYILLAALLLGSGVMTLVLTWHMTFYQDTFEFLINRRQLTVDAVMQPHNEHIVVIPVLIEQLFLHLFGMDTARPEYVLMTIGLAVAAGLVFVYVNRRLGPWLALFAAAMLLFLGPAWEVLLWPFEIGFIGSTLFGVAMLLVLEREDRAGDLMAAAFLLCSLGFSSLGIPFAAAALVALALRPRSCWLGCAWVVVVPVLAYGAWYLGWGHEAENHMSFHNLLASPRFVAEAAASALGSLFGLGPNPFSHSADPVWGRAMLILALVLLVVRQLRRMPLPLTFWPAATAAAANWFLTAFNQIPGRDPTTSRYQYAGCVLLLLVLANLLSGVRFSRKALIAAGAVTVLAIAPNLVLLGEGKDHLDDEAVLTRADTAAIEIARRTVEPEFELAPEIAGTPSLIDVFAGRYLEAVDEFGSPAYSVDELAGAPAPGRKQADIVLSLALPLSTKTITGRYHRGGKSCTTVNPGEARELPLGPGVARIEVAPGPQASFSLRRFATDEYPVATAGAPGNSETLLTIPHDEAPQPWLIHFEAQQRVSVCG